jgi:hypothetical protein
MKRPNRILQISALLSVAFLMTIPILPVHGFSWSAPIQVPLPTSTNTRNSLTQDSFQDIWLAYESSPSSGNSESYYTIYNFIAWTNPVPITSDHNNNESPSIQGLSNGTIFVAWVSNRTGSYNIWYKSYTNGVWSTESRLTTTTAAATDGVPSVVQDLHGNIWVFWQRIVSSNSNIFYQVYISGVGWGSPVQLTTESNPIDILPSATVTSNGWVWVVWSSHRTGSYQTFAKYFNGSTWTADTQLVSFKGDDSSPTITQTGDGTLWVAWTRDVSTGGQSFAQEVYYMNSTNLGSAWSAQTAITTDTSFDNFDPSLLESSQNQRLYIFWSSSMPANTNYNIFYESSSAILIHDLAVTRVGVNPTKLFPGGLKTVNMSAIVAINATISNLGNYQDTSTASVYANSTLIGSSSVTLLPCCIAGSSQIITANWNTTGFKVGCYQITVQVAPPPGQTATNNVMSGGWVRVIPFGDVDLDGKVSFIDAAVVALAFQTRPGSTNWNPYADSDGDFYVNFIDVSIMAINYGVSIPSC